MKSSPSRGISSLPKINPAGADNLPNTRRNTLSKYSMLNNHSVCVYIYTTTASTQTVFSERRLRYIYSTSMENSSEILRLVFSAADGIPALESMGLRCRSMLEQIHSICTILPHFTSCHAQCKQAETKKTIDTHTCCLLYQDPLDLNINGKNLLRGSNR